MEKQNKSRKKARPRRTFTPQFKDEAVRLCQVGDRTVTQVATDLDLTETALRSWVQLAAHTAATPAAGALTSEEREELLRLRRDNKRLQMERDILKKATAFFARESA
jgi:transposase